ncbi:MAG: hypothetical protein HIU86_03430 [Acidobacteria bacterium]|nr:hypothetical protein [Acidobacteriota bacterium]
MNGWDLELIVVLGGSHPSGERSSVARDVERGLLIRIRRGVYTAHAGFDSLSIEQQHIVRMRAVAAVAPGTVFSHMSAAVLHGLPVLRSGLARVHTTVPAASLRGRDGVAGHVFPLLDSEITWCGPLQTTAIGRTVVDVAGALPFGEGLMVADAALRSGVRRDLLEQAVALAGPRQSGQRIGNVVAVAHPGAESANESMSRAGMIRFGFEPPELQHELRDADGFVAALDFFFRRFRVGGEADGMKKLLDPAIATRGAGRALVQEKRREDRVLPLVRSLARWGWFEATRPVRLRQKLAAHGVHPPAARASISDYARAARGARPRR